MFDQFFVRHDAKSPAANIRSTPFNRNGCAKVTVLLLVRVVMEGARLGMENCQDQHREKDDQSRRKDKIAYFDRKARSP